MKQLFLLLIILTLASSTWISAQKRKADRAYSAFAAGEYYDATDLFKDAYSKTKKADKNSRTELVFMIAECYRLTNDPKNAETWYKLAVKSSYSKPEAQFWLAESMKRMGNIHWLLMNLKNTNRLLLQTRGQNRKSDHVNCRLIGCESGSL